MEVYLVGGAVRDRFLGLPIKEKDWCVVGSSPEEMKKRGYKSVGKDFPVFLHPETKEEYALARTEKKLSPATMDLILIPQKTSPYLRISREEIFLSMLWLLIKMIT